MSDVRILNTDDFDALAQIFADAYPGLGIVSNEDYDRFRQRVLRLHQEEPSANFYGLFRDRQLLGIMCLYDFQMNFLQASIPVGGVGQVAVGLPYKKEHIGKEMMVYFLRHYRAEGSPLVILYPFRPDFYRRMGFGYGTKMNQYRVKPSALPKGPSKAQVRYLDWNDRQALLDCYHRIARRTHGMIRKSEREVKRLFHNPQHRLVGYVQDGRIEGYLVFTFAPGSSFIINDLQVQEFFYENRHALWQLLTFLHTQADQIRYVVLNTLDEYLHHLLVDPRNDSEHLIPDVYHETNAQGVGLMYRLIDVPGMFDRLSERDFGGQTCRIRLSTTDSLLPENAGSTLLSLQNGYLTRLDAGSCDVEIQLDVADLSSLLAGTVNFTSLLGYGLAQISDTSYAQVLSRAFAVDQKPVCITQF